jgi:thermopsin
MRAPRRLVVLALLPLLLPSAAAFGHAAGLQEGSTVYSFVLQQTDYEYVPVDAFANTTVVYSVVSDVAVSAAFMTYAQFQGFNNSIGGVSNSLAVQNGTNIHESLRVGHGPYDILVYAYLARANVTLSFTVYPNNPLTGGPLTAPEPSGIASFGLTNQSGIDEPYAIRSTDVVGFASVSSLGAYNSSAWSVQSHVSGAGLQLNSELVVNGAGDGSQVYWCQNTPDFVTSASQLELADNIWNLSSSVGLMANSSITSEGGGGYVYSYQQGGTTQYYYDHEGLNSTYSLPIGMVLFLNSTVEPGTGVLVQVGAHLTGTFPGGVRGGGWFDNVTIHDPAVRSAYFLTSGNDTAPGGSYYDTELVWGGEANGEATTFTQMASSLGLFYANGTSTMLSAFPSYFSFGLETAESADNLRVAYVGDGQVRVVAGKANYDYLGAGSGALSTSAIESSLGFPGSSGTTTSSSSTGSDASTSGGSGSGAIPEFPYQAVLTPASVAALAVSYMWARRRSDSGPGSS